MPTTLAGHVAKHYNHVDSSPDENNNIGDVYYLETIECHSRRLSILENAIKDLLWSLIELEKKRLVLIKN